MAWDPIKTRRSVRRRRRELFKALAERAGTDRPRCWKCKSTRKLEIDHVDGRHYSLSGMSSHCRVAQYWREFNEGARLRIACRRHNAGFNPHRDPKPTEEECPF